MLLIPMYSIPLSWRSVTVSESKKSLISQLLEQPSPQKLDFEAVIKSAASAAGLGGCASSRLDQDL